MTLSDVEQREFFEKGWLIKDALFTLDEVHEMRACFDRLETRAGKLKETGLSDGAYFVLGTKAGEQIIKRVVWAGGAEPFLLTVGSDARLLNPVATLLGSSKMEQLLSQAHFKRPGDGVTFGWHQDIQHRDKGNDTWRDINGRGSFVQTLIVIDEMTPESGPLKFIPRSSNWGNLQLDEAVYDSRETNNAQLPFDPETAVTIEARAGDTIFFGPYTVHASFENTSTQYRRVFINGYAYPRANNRPYPGNGACRLLSVDRV